MNEVRRAGPPKERLRSALALANTLPASEFAAWAEGDRFDFRKGPELSVFRMAMFERWIKEDPEGLISWAGKNNYGQAGRALLHFAKNESERLIAHYRKHPDEKIELHLLKEVAKGQPGLALERLHELSVSGLSPGMERTAKGVLEELAQKTPAALEVALDDLSPALRLEAESALSGQRLIASFSTEVEALCQKAEGWSIFSKSFSNHPEFALRLIADGKELPENWKAGMAQQYYNYTNAENGREWFGADLESAGFSPVQAKAIRENALRCLTAGDPVFVLKNLPGLDVGEYNKTSIFFDVFRKVKDDPAETAKLVNALDSEEDRQLARQQLELAKLASDEGEGRKPSQWLETLGSIDGEKVSAYTVLGQLRRWDETQLAELRANFNGLPVEKKQNIARMVASVGIHSDVDPGFAGEAIRSLVLNPPADSNNGRHDPVMASSTHAVRLAASNPMAATTWIGTLPEGDAKRWAQKNVANHWRQFDPAAVDDWVKTLPSNDRDDVTEYLKTQKN